MLKDTHLYPLHVQCAKDSLTPPPPLVVPIIIKILLTHQITIFTIYNPTCAWHTVV